MPQTIFITGASAGIGRATARLFQNKGWNVVATMRNPDDAAQLAKLDNVLVTQLDVTDDASISSALAAAQKRFGTIDVLLNNAGYGAFGVLEAFSIESICRQFDTNVIGLLAVTKALLPHFRAHKSGMIVNVSSIGGQMTFPLGTLYHGTKFAVEGISEALHFEMATIGVHVKIVEPGLINTDFGGRSMDFCNDPKLTEYQRLIGGKGPLDVTPYGVSEPEVVADVIWTAATDGTDTLRYRAGDDANWLLDKRKAETDVAFIGYLKQQLDFAD